MVLYVNYLMQKYQNNIIPFCGSVIFIHRDKKWNNQ